jgi:hypothetical protein
VKAQTVVRQFDSRYRADTSLVLVPVTVTDPHSANINGLGRDNFAIRDNGRPQPISVFYTEDAPCSVGIVLDVSGSMKKTLELEKTAVRAFLQASNAEDEFFLVTVSSNPGAIIGPMGGPMGGPVGDAGEIDILARSATAGGGTALYDTIYLALHHGRLREKRRRALLVISDGMDNLSRYSKGELMNIAVESDTQVYTMAIAGSRPGVKGAELAEIQRGLQFMQDLAKQTGGMNVRLGDYENAPAAATRLAGALRNQYVIGYRNPDKNQSGKWHRIQVKVNLSKANVYARSGYQSQ